MNSFEYPQIQIGKYGTCTIKGNVQELNLGVEYTVKAKEISDKYGVGYEVINIKREKPTTLAATRNFLYEILTPNQTDTLLEAYPDIVDRIMNNRLDDIDLNKTKGIKDYTFNVIKQKVIENFKLADLVEEFRGLFSLSIIKKLYDKYPSVEKIKEVIRTLLTKGYSVEDIAVLSCYNVGDYGVIELNKRLQEAVNPNPDAKIVFGDSEFRLNDIVMNYANDYKAVLYNEEFLDDKNTTFIANGESGMVDKIGHNSMVSNYDGTLIYYDKGKLKNIRLAYAITTHKSQGGQFKVKKYQKSLK